MEKSEKQKIVIDKVKEIEKSTEMDRSRKERGWEGQKKELKSRAKSNVETETENRWNVDRETEEKQKRKVTRTIVNNVKLKSETGTLKMGGNGKKVGETFQHTDQEEWAVMKIMKKI